MQGITGIDERIWPLVFTPLAILLIFFAKNLYKVLEKIMMLLVMVMIIAFFINLLLVEPEIYKVAKGFIPYRFDDKNLDVVAALVATTFTLNGAIYQSYLAQSKGWKITQLKSGLIDTFMGIGLLAFISVVIIVTAATALYPLGIKVNSAADMAIQLESLFGVYAKLIFSIGLCAAAFSSLTVNAVIGGGLVADGFGIGSTMNEKMPKIFTTVILLLGMLIAVFFKGNVIYALIMAQASSILAVPLIAAGMFLVLNNKKVMGKFSNNIWQNMLAVLGFILICLMVYFMYNKLIAYLITL
jgi:Mn2+/Fe2+ NRAMP family transporter